MFTLSRALARLRMRDGEPCRYHGIKIADFAIARGGAHTWAFWSYKLKNCISSKLIS